ncbi:MAG TPA: hypothetical protein VKA02_11240, partial [Candidatus Acidoferrum sp.]|nr:hypothetical protein [Candidatus Acidoferrum sp.]
KREETLMGVLLSPKTYRRIIDLMEEEGKARSRSKERAPQKERVRRVAGIEWRRVRERAA